PAKERLAKEGIEIFPDDLSFLGDFEEAAEGRFGDQRIAVGQALGDAHARREEVPSRLILVLPYDLVGGRIDLDHPRIRQRVVETMDAVVEYQHVAVRQQSWRVLAGDRRRTKLP